MSDQASGDGKPKMPQVLKELGTKAIAKHERRSATPEIEIGSEGGQWTFKSPYSDDDLSEWEALLFEAFATRSNAAFYAFTNQLAQLCESDWQGEGTGWLPRAWDLRAAIQIVRSVRPRNEAEACLAAQIVAVHLMQMKLSAQALRYSSPDPRSCAIAGKLARTYAMQLETMAKLRGKGSRQRITVRKYSKHEHKHIHLHQGDGENGNQPHGPKGARATEIKAAREASTGAALPRPNPQEHSLYVPRDQGEEALPHPRRSGGDRSTER